MERCVDTPMLSMGRVNLLTSMLLVLTALASTTTQADTTAPSLPIASLSGEQAFTACAACHSLAPEAPHKVGPNLYGVVNSPAAAAEGFNYSPALRDSGLTWSRENLFAWIAGSEALVPGSWMLYHNVLSGEEVLSLIDYLADNAP